MGFFSSLFGGKANEPENTTPPLADYPQRFTISPDISPLLANADELIAAVLADIGETIDVSNLILQGKRIVEQSESTNQCWERLTTLCGSFLPDNPKAALTLSHCLWSVFVPLEAPPLPPNLSIEDHLKAIVEKIATHLASAGITVDKDFTSSHLGGGIGPIGLNVFIRAFGGAEIQRCIELQAQTYIGRLDVPEGEDGVGETLSILDEIVETPIAYHLDEGSLQGNLHTIYGLAQLDDNSLKEWSDSVIRLLGKSYRTAGHFSNNKNFTLYQGRSSNAPKALFDQLAAEYESLQKRTKASDDGQLVQAANLLPSTCLESISGRYYLRWGDDKLRVLVRSDRCLLLVPIQCSFPHAAKTAIQLNRVSDYAPRSGIYDQWGSCFRGGWTVMHDDAMTGRPEQEWNLAYVISGDTTDSSFLAKVILEFRNKLKSLGRKIESDQPFSYLNAWKKANPDKGTSLWESLYYYHPRINPRRHYPDELTPAQKAEAERERLHQERLKKDREIAVINARLAIFAGDPVNALRYIDQAESVRAGRDTQLLKALAAISSGKFEDVHSILANFAGKSDLQAIVMKGFASKISGNTVAAERFFGRAISLLY